MEDWTAHVEKIGRAARVASRTLTNLTGAQKTALLAHIASALRQNTAALLDANTKDISAARESSLPSNLIERLKLSDKKVEQMALAVDQIAAQTDPVGQIIEGYVRPNGLRIQKMRCPLGVLLFIYESRPNVTSDAAALALKSGNAIILRGGKESIHSNRAIASVIHSALRTQHSALENAVQLIESTDRSLVTALLKLDKYIDLVIPRGGESLIRAVVTESTIPVLKHFTGNCHIYIDSHTTSMEDQVRSISVNAKTSYPGGAVCNAVEHILFHKDAAPRLLAKVAEDLASKGVEIRADEKSRSLYPKAKPTTEEDWSTEYLAPIVGLKIVDSLDAAITHINHYGSHHTDAILTESLASADAFTKSVDSASIMVNASTRFADGGEYGLGAEVGISTDKLHARGPMGAMDLTTYKWVVTGDGHVR
jgi:glutamate-5-semialdehyde dehydrogenase